MKIKIKISGYRCDKCEHEWISKDKTKMPRMCPKCKSVKWNDDKKKCKK